jgi:hypothetical protein
MLDEIKRQEVSHVDVAATIRELTESFRMALRDCPPGPYSGLIEQQRYLSRWRCRI